MEKQKVYTAILSDHFIFKNADWFLSKHCRRTIFSWASVPIPDFLDQQETFATSARPYWSRMVLYLLSLPLTGSPKGGFFNSGDSIILFTGSLLKFT